MINCSFRIQRLRESGVLYKLERKHFDLRKNQVCTPDHDVAQSTLGTADVWSMFVVLGGGIALGSVVLLIEYMMYTVQKYLRSSIKSEQRQSGN